MDVSLRMESVASEPSRLAIVLGLFYLVLTLLVFVQIAKIVYFGHNLFSFQSGFLMLCLIWSVLRALVFLTPMRPSALVFFLEWLPTTLQFATFLLLSMFYAYVVERSDWEPKRKIWRVGLVTSTVCSAVITAVCCLLLFVADVNAVRRFYILYAGLIFLVLSVLLLYYSYRLYDLGQHPISNPLNAVGQNRRKYQAATRMLGISALLIVSFLSRAFSDLAAAMGWMGYGALEGNRLVDGFGERPIQAAVMLLFWEIVPALVLVGYFWHIPQNMSSFSSLSSRGAGYAHARSRYGATGPVLPTLSLQKYATRPPEAFLVRQGSLTPPPPPAGEPPAEPPAGLRTSPPTAHRTVSDTSSEGRPPIRTLSGSSSQVQSSRLPSMGPDAPRMGLTPGRSGSQKVRATPPSYTSRVIEGNRPLLDNPHRYDTDEEGTTPRR